MLPIWPNTDKIPIWFWLLLAAGFIGVALVVSSPGFDMYAAGERFRQALVIALMAGGVFWMWHGGLTLLRVRALTKRGVAGEAEITDLYASSQRVQRSGTFAVGHTTITQHFLTYRFQHPGGEATAGPMSIDRKLAGGLKKGGTVRIRFLPEKPKVSAPENIAIAQVRIMRALQLAAGLALFAWAAIWLAPGVLWPVG